MQGQLETIKGYSHNIHNSIITIDGQPGAIKPLSNQLIYYQSPTITTNIYKTKLEISALCSSGSLIGIGTKGLMGSLTTTTIINFHTKSIQQFQYQKTLTKKIAISKNGVFLCTIGQSNSNNQQLCILEVDQRNSKLGTDIFAAQNYPIKQRTLVDVIFSPHSQNTLAVLFSNQVILYLIQKKHQTRKLSKESNEKEQETKPYSYQIQEKIPITTSKVRVFSMFIFNPFNKLCYVSSNNGDISQISLIDMKQTRVGPRKRVIINGILFIRMLNQHHIVIVGKNGFIALIELADMKILREVTLKETINSISQFKKEGYAYISTNKAQFYSLDGQTLEVQLLYECHYQKVNDIVFMDNYSQVLASCAGNRIVIWLRDNLVAKLKIQIPKITCQCLNFTKNGKYLISGWSDMTIRVIIPTTGKIIHKIQKCHPTTITSIITTQLSNRLISGDDSGLIRLWNLQGKIFGQIQGTLVFHRKRIYTLKINPYEGWILASGSEDGYYAIWNINTFEKVGQGLICNYVKGIQFDDKYNIYLVGGSRFIYHCLRSTGQVLQKYPFQMSYFNSFVKVIQDDRLFFVLGGQMNQIILAQIDIAHKNKVLTSTLDTYSQVTKIAISPDRKNVIVGTSSGFMLSFLIKVFLPKIQ